MSLRDGTKCAYRHVSTPTLKLVLALLEKEKLARKISDGKNEIPHKFLDRKI